MGVEREQIGDCTLYRGDCQEILSTLGHVDAVITDPPYGISFNFTKKRTRRCTLRDSGRQLHVQNIADRAHGIYGDNESFNPLPWLAYRYVILWGAQHYSARLPTSPAWLIWDKRCGHTSDRFADCEMAWTNLHGPARIHQQLWRGTIRQGEENPSRNGKCYPSQKPLALMRWCVEKTMGMVLDPYMGSGSTGVACIQLGRPFLGIEIDHRAFDLACQRITEAQRQGVLFAPAAPQQLRLVEASA